MGCGAGEPIARYFIEQGHQITGIDFAEPAIELARQRFPGHGWQVGDMRALDLPQRFDGIVAWHSFFHLSPDDQPPVLKRFSVHLKAGGSLMITVGPEAGEVIGHVSGENVYHASLAPQEYTTLLGKLGLNIEAFVRRDPECDFASVLLARKS